MPLIRVHRDTEFIDNLPNAKTISQYAQQNGISVDEAATRMISEGWQFVGINSSGESVYSK